MNHFASLLLVLTLATSAVAQDRVWPGKDWATATPESQGLNKADLDAAAAYALEHGGGSGCVIRHGFLVLEWGSPTKLADIKSATKGSFGTTMLGLAIDAGLVKIDDLAQKHYPDLGTEKKDNPAGWLKEITVRHLATMTAGFDDGRPPLLVYRPGTKGIYSNDTSNMLAEFLTLRYKQDLYPIVKSKVMDPIGASPTDWKWRENAFRPRTIGDLKSREFASGITITHRALARIGYLYLREGKWKDRQILSREFIQAATKATDLPAPWPYYGYYWGSNSRGSLSGIPKDAYWALGLGDSMVLVCPSLDLVAVRLGTGSLKSQLPGGKEWGPRVEGFFKRIVQATRPASPVIKEVQWAGKETILRQAKGSDIWPMTWGDDDAQYTAYGDGWGFDPRVPFKLSMGIAKVVGTPPRISGVNLRTADAEHKGDGLKGRKPSGIVMIKGVLYLWVRNADNSALYWSADHGKSWSVSPWKWTTSFGCPTFLNFGKDYAGARDRYVYTYSPDSDTAYQPADRMILARVSQDQIKDRDAYEFFQKLDDRGQPVWTRDVKQRGAVFSRPGKCYRGGVTYIAGLKRYVWCQTLPEDTKPARYGLAVYDAPEPWGPWTEVYRAEPWDVDAGETCSFPTRWMSEDGKTLHLVFSGNDNFCVRKATLVLREGKK